MKIPRSEKQLNRILQEVRDAAYERGKTSGALDERKAIDADLRTKKERANLEALRAVAQLAQSTGQAIEAMCRAMYDGRGM